MCLVLNFIQDSNAILGMAKEIRTTNIQIELQI